VSPEGGEVRCGHCELTVPAGEFCCRCGMPLDLDHPHPRVVGRRSHHYAASPNEPAWALRLTSTLFPQLPVHAMGAFRIALASGVGLILLLGFLGVFSVALLAAAVLVPLLMLLYLYNVDVYEDEPFLVVGLTLLCGAAGGILIGVVAGHLALPVQQHGWDQLTTGRVLVRTVVLPLAALGLALVGPLVLLRHPRFNDVLDGVVFGAASAVALQSATLLVADWPTTRLGLRPQQDVTAWTLRLVELGVFVPLIVAGGVGWAGAALWARYRAPIRDRRALGPLGGPVSGVLVAAVLGVAAAVVQEAFGTLGRLFALAVLAGVGLLLMRQAIHLGLLEEANDTEPGPEVICSNCGRPTPVHTFCIACGVALRALPKGPVGGPPSPP
jgi:RsiW-degrading membrane proteinase PrsW (M82 family)